MVGRKVVSGPNTVSFIYFAGQLGEVWSSVPNFSTAKFGYAPAKFGYAPAIFGYGKPLFGSVKIIVKKREK